MTPARPMVREIIRFEITLSYDGPERPRKFNVDYWFEGNLGKEERPDCDSPQPTPDRWPLERRIVTEVRYDYPGPYAFIARAWPACVADDSEVNEYEEFTVGGTVDLPRRQVLLPHWEPRDSTAIGTNDITIEGDAKTTCVWAVLPSGERRASMWPIGYRAKFGPLRIYNERNKEVWREGVPRDNAGQPTRAVGRVRKTCRTGVHGFRFS